MNAAFPALGFDPAPGDPGAVSALSREAQRVSREVRTLSDELRRLGEVHALWQGTAAEEFAQLIKRLPDSLHDTGAAFDIVARRLSHWELTLIELQASARGLEAEAQASRQRREALWHTASAQEPSPVPPARFGPVTGQALIGAPTTPGDTQGARAQARNALVQGCKDELAQIVARALKLQQRAKQEGDQVAADVRRATAYAPPPPGVFEQVGDWFDEIDRAVGNFVNNHIQDFQDLADAVALLGFAIMLIPGVGLVPGLVIAGVAVAASGALARYADGSSTDVALALAGVGVGGAAAFVGRRMALARAAETGTAVQPPRSIWAAATSSGPREGRWLWTHVAVTLPLGFGLGFHGVADVITRRRGRQPPSPDDPKPRLQVVLPTAPAVQVPSRGGQTPGPHVTPAVGAPEPGRRSEARHLLPTMGTGARDLVPMPIGSPSGAIGSPSSAPPDGSPTSDGLNGSPSNVGPVGSPTSDGPTRRPATIGGP